MFIEEKIVEHFATSDDPLVDEFVAKLRSLMQREDVQTALKNNQGIFLYYILALE